MTGKVVGKVGAEVTLHVAKDVVLKLFEEIVEVEVEVLGPGSFAERRKRASAKVILLPLGRVREDLVSWDKKRKSVGQSQRIRNLQSNRRPQMLAKGKPTVNVLFTKGLSLLHVTI